MKKSACAALFFLDRREEQCTMVESVADGKPRVSCIVNGTGADRLARCDIGI